MSGFSTQFFVDLSGLRLPLLSVVRIAGHPDSLPFLFRRGGPRVP